MLKIARLTTLATILLAGSNAMAWSTPTTISGAGSTAQVQGYAWKDLGGGAWEKWNSVATSSTIGGGLRAARRTASNTSPSWSAWTVEDIDLSEHVMENISIAIDNNSGATFVSYVDDSTGDLKFATRVGLNAGNCFSGSNWDCVTLDSTAGTTVTDASIGVMYDDAIPGYAIHIVYARLNGSTGQSSLRYARKLGGAAWSTALIRNTGYVSMNPDAFAFVGRTPVVAYGESGQGLQFSEFEGPAMGNWVTTTVDSDPTAGNASLDTRALDREIAYTVYDGSIILKSARYNWFAKSWGRTTVDTDIRAELSIAMDDDSVPHIAYKKVNFPKRAKRVSGAWGIETVDSTFNTGYGPSIQIDKQLSVDKAIVTHGDGFFTVRVSTE